MHFQSGWPGELDNKNIVDASFFNLFTNRYDIIFLNISDYLLKDLRFTQPERIFN